MDYQGFLYGIHSNLHVLLDGSFRGSWREYYHNIRPQAIEGCRCVTAWHWYVEAAWDHAHYKARRVRVFELPFTLYTRMLDKKKGATKTKAVSSLLVTSTTINKSLILTARYAPENTARIVSAQKNPGATCGSTRGANFGCFLSHRSNMC